MTCTVMMAQSSNHTPPAVISATGHKASSRRQSVAILRVTELSQVVLLLLARGGAVG